MTTRATTDHIFFWRGSWNLCNRDCDVFRYKDFTALRRNTPFAVLHYSAGDSFSFLYERMVYDDKSARVLRGPRSEDLYKIVCPGCGQRELYCECAV